MSSNDCNHGGNNSGMPDLGENEEPVRLRGLDLSQWESVTPSYRRFPPAYAHPQQCAEHNNSGVLNNEVVIQRVETSERHLLLDEKELLEERRYESDLLEVAIAKMEELMRGVEDKKIKLDVSFSLKDHIPAYCMGLLREMEGIDAIEKRHKGMLRHLSNLLEKKRETNAKVLQKERDRQEKSLGGNSRKRKKPMWTSDYEL